MNTINVQGELGSFQVFETNGLFASIYYGMFGSVPHQDMLDRFVDTYINHISDLKSIDEKCKKILDSFGYNYSEYYYWKLEGLNDYLCKPINSYN